jgi:hypothetical protein
MGRNGAGSGGPVRRPAAVMGTDVGAGMVAESLYADPDPARVAG